MYPDSYGVMHFLLLSHYTICTVTYCALYDPLHEFSTLLGAHYVPRLGHIIISDNILDNHLEPQHWCPSRPKASLQRESPKLRRSSLMRLETGVVPPRLAPICVRSPKKKAAHVFPLTIIACCPPWS